MGLNNPALPRTVTTRPTKPPRRRSGSDDDFVRAATAGGTENPGSTKYTAAQEARLVRLFKTPAAVARAKASIARAKAKAEAKKGKARRALTSGDDDFARAAAAGGTENPGTVVNTRPLDKSAANVAKAKQAIKRIRGSNLTGSDDDFARAAKAGGTENPGNVTQIKRPLDRRAANVAKAKAIIRRRRNQQEPSTNNRLTNDDDFKRAAIAGGTENPAIHVRRPPAVFIPKPRRRSIIPGNEPPPAEPPRSVRPGPVAPILPPPPRGDEPDTDDSRETDDGGNGFGLIAIAGIAAFVLLGR